MKTVLTVTGVVVLVSVLFCTVVQAQKTSAAHDENVDFSNYKTFAFDKAGEGGTLFMPSRKDIPNADGGAHSRFSSHANFR